MKRRAIIALTSAFAAGIGVFGHPANAAASNCPVYHESWCIPYYYGCPDDLITECNIEYSRWSCSAYDADCYQDGFYCPPNPSNPGEPAGYYMQCWFSP